MTCSKLGDSVAARRTVFNLIPSFGPTLIFTYTLLPADDEISIDEVGVIGGITVASVGNDKAQLLFTGGF